MPRDGTATRTRILDTAESLILNNGFAGTSVDAITEAAGVTKGAFFHHFASKADLGQALVERYAALDAQHLDHSLTRAESLSRDPLQQLLLVVAFFEEAMESPSQDHPGCLYASYCYEAQLFDEQTHTVIRQALDQWRERLGAKVREAAQKHPPLIAVDPDAVVDLLWVIFEGAFVLARVTGDPKSMAPQLRQYRNYLELLFGAVPRPIGA